MGAVLFRTAPLYLCPGTRPEFARTTRVPDRNILSGATRTCSGTYQSFCNTYFRKYRDYFDSCNTCSEKNHIY